MTDLEEQVHPLGPDEKPLRLGDIVKINDSWRCDPKYVGLLGHVVGISGDFYCVRELHQVNVRVHARRGEITLIAGWTTECGPEPDGWQEDVALPRFVGSSIQKEPFGFPSTYDTKPTNPKDAIGSDKLPLHLWPMPATALGCVALLDGALKYGRSNWRDAGVRATIYVDALIRHVTAYLEGEDVDPDSGVPHLGHALACLAILVDAEAAGKLIDDRNYNGAGWRPLVEELTPHVARLKERHAARSPKHFSIADDPKGVPGAR